MLFRSQKFTFIALIMLTASSTREVLVNGQSTGLVLGLFAFLQRYFDEKKNNRTPAQFLIWDFLAGTAIIFILDLKPNVVLFPLVILFMSRKRYRPLIIGLSTWTIHIVCFSYFTSSNLIQSWLTNLTQVTDFESNSTLFGSLGPWQLLNDFAFP